MVLNHIILNEIQYYLDIDTYQLWISIGLNYDKKFYYNKLKYILENKLKFKNYLSKFKLNIDFYKYNCFSDYYNWYINNGVLLHGLKNVINKSGYYKIRNSYFNEGLYLKNDLIYTYIINNIIYNTGFNIRHPDSYKYACILFNNEIKFCYNMNNFTNSFKHVIPYNKIFKKMDNSYSDNKIKIYDNLSISNPEINPNDDELFESNKFIAGFNNDNDYDILINNPLKPFKRLNSFLDFDQNCFGNCLNNYSLDWEMSYTPYHPFSELIIPPIISTTFSNFKIITCRRHFYFSEQVDYDQYYNNAIKERKEAIIKDKIIHEMFINCINQLNTKSKKSTISFKFKPLFNNQKAQFGYKNCWIYDNG